MKNRGRAIIYSSIIVVFSMMFIGCKKSGDLPPIPPNGDVTYRIFRVYAESNVPVQLLITEQDPGGGAPDSLQLNYSAYYHLSQVITPKLGAIMGVKVVCAKASYLVFHVSYKDQDLGPIVTNKTASGIEAELDSYTVGN